MRYAYLERPYKVEPDLLAAMPELGADKPDHTLRLRRGRALPRRRLLSGRAGPRTDRRRRAVLAGRRFADARINTKRAGRCSEGKIAGLDAYRAATAQPGASDDALARLPIEGLKKVDVHADDPPGAPGPALREPAGNPRTRPSCRWRP